MLLKLAEILLANPNVNVKSSINKIREITRNLLFSNPSNEVYYEENDIDFLISMIFFESERYNLINRLNKIEFSKQDKLLELEQTSEEYKKILPKLKEISQYYKEIRDATREIKSHDQEVIDKLQNAIINILEIKKEKGLNHTSLTLLIKKTFVIDTQLVRQGISDLLDKEILVKSNRNDGLLILKKYFKGDLIPKHGNLQGRTITVNQFFKEIHHNLSYLRFLYLNPIFQLTNLLHNI